MIDNEATKVGKSRFGLSSEPCSIRLPNRKTSALASTRAIAWRSAVSAID